MESPSQAEETSWRVSAVYNRIFRPRPAARKIKKRESVTILGSTSASAPSSAPALPPNSVTAAAGHDDADDDDEKEEFAGYTFRARATSSSPSLP